MFRAGGRDSQNFASLSGAAVRWQLLGPIGDICHSRYGYFMTRRPTNIVMASFDSLPWHDAELQELTINRREPGTRDEVRLQVVWRDGGRAALLFGECYGFTAEMNFGVIAEEQIAAASIIEDDPYLISLRDRWKTLSVSLDLLRCYQFETSSTGSIIRIYAMEFAVVNLSEIEWVPPHSVPDVGS